MRSCFVRPRPWANYGRTCDPEALADFYLNSFEGALLRAKVSKSPAPLRLFLTCMFDRVLQGRPAGA